jgi:hypothetical protein
MESPSSGGFLVYELVIPGGILFLVHGVVIPGRIPIYSMQCECWHIPFQTSSGWKWFQDFLLLCSMSVSTSLSNHPPDVNDSWIHYSRVVGVLAQRVPKVLWIVTIQGFLTGKDLYCQRIFFRNLNMKTLLKWKINLIRPYYDLQIYPLKSIKGTKISWDYPLKVNWATYRTWQKIAQP